jgi:hypothetical protein
MALMSSGIPNMISARPPADRLWWLMFDQQCLRNDGARPTWP